MVQIYAFFRNNLVFFYTFVLTKVKLIEII